MLDTVIRQLKTLPRDYFTLLSLICILVCTSTLTPYVGGTFLCNFISVYRVERLLEVYQDHPIHAVIFEVALTFTTMSFLFRFLKPFFIVLIVIRQRLRIVRALRNVSPVNLQALLNDNVQFEGADFWDASELWTTLWYVVTT